MPKIDMSIIVPAYNEMETIPSLVDSLQSIVSQLKISYEIIIIDDGSEDESQSLLESIALHNSSVVPVFLSRNFGKEAALSAGLSVASGQCLIFIDADLQHPPELIRNMYQYWKKGFDVIQATKRRRGNESMLYKAMARQFNKIMTQAIGQDMAGASDFMLIDRQVADVILGCPEKARFFRGLIAWAGFKVKKIEFDVQERMHGETKWTGLSLIRYSIVNILSFSAMPLRAVGYIGFITAILGGILLIQTLVSYGMGKSAIGFTTVIAVQILLGGMVLVALGIISIYLSGMYYEQKNRPLFIIRKPRDNIHKNTLLSKRARNFSGNDQYD